jgi:hypothetical protein
MLFSSNIPRRLTNFFFDWLITTTVGREFNPNFTAKSLRSSSQRRAGKACTMWPAHLWHTPSTRANLYALPPPIFTRTASITATCSLIFASSSRPSITATAHRPMSPQARVRGVSRLISDRAAAAGADLRLGASEITNCFKYWEICSNWNCPW